VAARLVTRLVAGPPRTHPGLELVGDGLAEPRVEAAHLADRVGLHGAEVDVVEAGVGAAGAEPQRAVHAHRPVLDVELAEVAAVEVVGEQPGDVGVHVGHRHHDVGGIAVRHHEPGVGEGAVEVVEPQHVRRGLQPPRPRRLAPLQELEHPSFVGVRRRVVGVEEPGRVRRDDRERLEELRTEVECHQLEALHRTVDLGRDGPAAAHECGRGRDAGVVALDGRRWRARRARLPHAQEAHARILREHERQRSGAGARQPETEQRRVDPDVVDLGVAAVPVLHLEALPEVIDDARVQHGLADGVEVGLVA
jgi:hypothetical protein